MTEILFEKGALINLGAISREEDLEQPGRIVLNGPPSDGRCDVCGRHISELKPFGGPGDPLVGDFGGELLVKTFRPDGPYNGPAERAWKEAEKAVGPEGDILSWLISKYGENLSDHIRFNVDLHGSIGKSWECRECIVLDEEEYFEKIALTHEEKVRRIKQEEDKIPYMRDISREESFKSRDGRCEVCGRHFSELKPFGRPGDPLGAPDDPRFGHFNGAILLERFRTCFPYDEAAERALGEAAKAVPRPKDILPWLISKYGEKLADLIFFKVEAHASSKSSWECRDCIILDEDEYFKKRFGGVGKK